MSAPGFTLRPFRGSDRAALLTFAPRFVAFDLPAWHDPVQVVMANQRLLAQLQPDEPDSLVLVAEASGALAGFVEVRVEHDYFSAEPQAYLASIAVAPGAEGRGLGRALVAAAEDWARARGLPTLTLHVFAANARARGFYAALGFQEDTLKLTKPLKEFPA